MASAMTPLSTAQAAAIARVNPATVCRWCDGGGLRHTTTALGHRVIAQSDLETFLAARRQRQEGGKAQSKVTAVSPHHDPNHEAKLARIRAMGAS